VAAPAESKEGEEEEVVSVVRKQVETPLHCKKFSLVLPITLPKVPSFPELILSELGIPDNEPTPPFVVRYDSVVEPLPIS